ncbi:hypothetical protein RIF29_29272 [Crotalaria pallida]|uniref:Legume lectin domain-containing protein n=1 Tax=Crotalaria pallida TaxID=3830 RepID=A0AAN9HW43_CROPI
MATSNLKSTQFLLAITFITFFLLLLHKANSSSSSSKSKKHLSFSINKFSPNESDLIFQGDAHVLSTGELQLTKVENSGLATPESFGRVLYTTPVKIWNSKNGKEASFTTSFSFVINSPDPGSPADGLAFFIASPDFPLGPTQPGGFLGLFNDQSVNSSNQIVAVEFDTYTGNDWDPSLRHIGIDVNSIVSSQTAVWNWRNVDVANVIITYVAHTKTLTATLTYPSDQASFTLTASVDLKATLPESVRVGFSAATGGLVEIHNILRWSFKSTFKSKI